MFFGPVNEVEKDYPPYEPILQGNDTVKWRKEYKLQAHVYDPNDDKITLIVQWDWENETNTTYGPFESGATVTLSHTYDEIGDIGETKSIKVKAVDEDGLESGWSYKGFRVKLAKAKHMEIFERLPVIHWLLTHV